MVSILLLFVSASVWVAVILLLLRVAVPRSLKQEDNSLRSLVSLGLDPAVVPELVSLPEPFTQQPLGEIPREHSTLG